MIVARQFIAWNTPKKGEPSRRDGVSRAARHIHLPWSKNVLSTESYRSLRDGFFVWHTPGNKLPGYDHSVPPGQRLSTPVHKFDARSQEPRLVRYSSFFVQAFGAAQTPKDASGKGGETHMDVATPSPQSRTRTRTKRLVRALAYLNADSYKDVVPTELNRHAF
jgi:hypothetical protein